MPLVLRSVKGSALTIAELDGNFTFLQTAIDDINANIPQANSVANIVQTSATQFVIYLDDGTPFGPFNIPSAVFTFRGEWAASTAYNMNDIFTYERAGLYLSLQGHVSETTFDPAEENSDGALYQLILELFSGSIPKEISTTTYTAVLLDANRYLYFTAAAGCIFTIPAHASVEFEIGAELHIRQAAAGQVVTTGAAGVTINPPRDGYETETPWLYANATLKKISANVWDYIGPGSEPTG